MWRDSIILLHKSWPEDLIFPRFEIGEFVAFRNVGETERCDSATAIFFNERVDKLWDAVKGSCPIVIAAAKNSLVDSAKTLSTFGILKPGQELRGVVRWLTLVRSGDDHDRFASRQLACGVVQTVHNHGMETM